MTGLSKATARELLIHTRRDRHPFEDVRKKAKPEELPLLDQYQTCTKDPKKTKMDCYNAIPKDGSPIARPAPTKPAAAPEDVDPAAMLPQTPEEKRAIEILEHFLSEIAKKGVKLTGDPGQDEDLIFKAWDVYKKTNENNPKVKDGLNNAEQALFRWLGFARATSVFSMHGTKIFNEDVKRVGNWISAIACTGQLVGLSLRGLSSQGIGSDTGALVFLLKPFMDLTTLNKDLGGSFNFRDPAFGMLFRAYNNPTIRNVIQELPVEYRPWVQNALTLFTILPLARTFGIQDEMLANPFITQNISPPFVDGVPEAKSLRLVVLPLIHKLLSTNGDLGLIPAGYRTSADIRDEYGTAANITTAVMRGAFALTVFLIADRRAELTVATKGNMASAFPEGMDVGDPTNKDQILRVSEGDIRASFSSMMNSSFVIADNMLLLGNQIAKRANAQDSTANKVITPLAAMGLANVLLYFAIVNPLRDNPDPRGKLGFENPDIYKDTGTLQPPGAIKAAAKDAAGDLWLPFFLGTLERTMAAYSKHPEEVGDAFLMVNNLLARNISFTKTAIETFDRFTQSGQGEGDPYYTLTKTMGTLWTLDGLIPSAWAGIEAGSVMAKSEFPFIEAAPFLTGLIIQLSFLNDAGKIEGMAHDDLVTQQWANLLTYVGLAGLSFGMTYWLDVSPDIEFDFKWAGDRYKVAIAPGPGGVAIKGTFGAPEETQTFPLEKRLALQEEHHRALLEIKTKELNRIYARFSQADYEPDHPLFKQAQDLTFEIFKLQSETSQITAERLALQVTELDKALQSGMPIPYEGKKWQQDFLLAKIRPALTEKEKKLNEALTALNEAKRDYSNPNGGTHVLSFTPKFLPFTAEEQRKKTELETQLAHVQSQLRSVQKRQNLASIYREETGQDLSIKGLNPLLAEYRAQLAKIVHIAALQQKLLGS